LNPKKCFNKIYSTGLGSNGAWQKFERGEIDLLPFYEAFGRELSDTKHANAWSGFFSLNPHEINLHDVQL